MGRAVQDELTDEFLSVTLGRVDDDPDARTIELEAHGARAEELLRAIDGAVASDGGGDRG